ncbi:MAG: ATP-binding protein [Bacteroidota bacterium]
MKNPFKFGSVVEGSFFTNRKEELIRVQQIIASENHLILISPRRFGKTSLIYKACEEVARPVISLDLQLVTGVPDFAAQLLKKIFKVYPLEKVKHLLTHFRIIPTLALNPMTNVFEISFQPVNDNFVLLEDVFQLIEILGKKGKKPIVVLDEFQEISNMDKQLDKQLRSVLQNHKHVNYVFLGSLESMMKDIFEKKKSPFYHFGVLLTLDKIPYPDFFEFLKKGFGILIPNSDALVNEILGFTNCHPYYTQQLAFNVWMSIEREGYNKLHVNNSIEELVLTHDMDYERLWNTLNQTDKKILIGVINEPHSLLKEEFSRKISVTATSTVFSGLKRLVEQGYLIKHEKYELDDPFFKRWINNRRNLI